MKKKKINLKESALLQKEEMKNVKGGDRARHRVTNEDGSRTKVVVVS